MTQSLKTVWCTQVRNYKFKYEGITFYYDIVERQSLGNYASRYNIHLTTFGWRIVVTYTYTSFVPFVTY